MTHFNSPSTLKASSLVLLLCLAALSPPVLAEKPDWAGNGKGKKKQVQEEQANVNIQIGAYFGEHQRVAASEYYEAQGRAGKCPPGLAKKHNGCQPPGQAKKWKLGQRLERDVVVYPVPQDVVVRIGLPPAGYRYVRVLNDVLLVAVGSNMVVDAIEDLMR